jgi:site-specific DNA-cytosine methylase
MSPPCQPFTRQGQQKDDADLRSAGLLHLIEILAAIEAPPVALAVENVAGFERSHCRQMLTAVLKHRGYHIEEHMLSPWQVGVPLERMRYYLLAWLPRNSLSPPSIDAALLPTLPPPPLLLLTSPPVSSHHSLPLFSYLLPPQNLNPSLFLSPLHVQKFHGQILDVVPAAAATSVTSAVATATEHEFITLSQTAHLARASTFTKAFVTPPIIDSCCALWNDTCLSQIWRKVHEG